eukprot:COSAG02_NODE_8748_length_2456_cov_47.772168_2_plen_123_part_00
MHVASSRVGGWWKPSNWYFQLLEVSWPATPALMGIIIFIYGFLLLLNVGFAFAEQFHFDKVFEDVMVLDEARSQPGEPPSFRVDFSKFHDVQDLAPAVFSPGGTRQTVTPSHGAYLDVKMCF